MFAEAAEDADDCVRPNNRFAEMELYARWASTATPDPEPVVGPELDLYSYGYG